MGRDVRVFGPRISTATIRPGTDPLEFRLALVQPYRDRPNRGSACDDDVIFAVAVDVGGLKTYAGFAFSDVCCQPEFRATCRKVDTDLVERTAMPDSRGFRYAIAIQVMAQLSPVGNLPMAGMA